MICSAIIDFACVPFSNLYIVILNSSNDNEKPQFGIFIVGFPDIYAKNPRFVEKMKNKK